MRSTRDRNCPTEFALLPECAGNTRSHVLEQETVLDRVRGETRDRTCRDNRYCVGEVIVQGDEGPVVGVAQGVHCHGVTVSHEEKEEEEIEQEVESDEEKTLKERCACPWMG